MEKVIATPRQEQRLRMSYEEFLAWAEEMPDSLQTFAEIVGPSRVMKALQEMATHEGETGD